MNLEPSPARRGLDLLLRAYPHFDLLAIDWQVEPSDGRSASHWRGPWLLVQMGQPSDLIEIEPAWAVWHFAIWKHTGAVHTMSGPGGAVSDDPIFAPT